MNNGPQPGVNYAPWNPNANQKPKRRRIDSEGAMKSSRYSCDVFIFLDIFASIAFIIATLCPVSWISYSSAVDNTANSSYPLYYFSRTRNLFSICPNSAQSAVNAIGCVLLDLASAASVAPATDIAYWLIIGMRRTEVALFIIAVILAGFTVLLHLFCCIPSCRHLDKAKHGFWKNGLAGGILSGLSAACQLAGMIVYSVNQYYEVVYNGINCVDCWGYWPLTITTQTASTFGPAYALGWCAAGLLSYASFAYLMREFCVVRGCQAPHSYAITDDKFSEVGSAVPSLAPPKGLAREMQFNIFGQQPQRAEPQIPRPIPYPSLRGYYN